MTAVKHTRSFPTHQQERVWKPLRGGLFLVLCLLLRSCPLDLSWTKDRNNSPVLLVQDQHEACQVTQEHLQPSKARPGTRCPTAKGVQLLAAALEICDLRTALRMSCLSLCPLLWVRSGHSGVAGLIHGARDVKTWQQGGSACSRLK